MDMEQSSTQKIKQSLMRCLSTHYRNTLAPVILIEAVVYSISRVVSKYLDWIRVLDKIANIYEHVAECLSKSSYSYGYNSTLHHGRQ